MINDPSIIPHVLMSMPQFYFFLEMYFLNYISFKVTLAGEWIQFDVLSVKIRPTSLVTNLNSQKITGIENQMSSFSTLLIKIRRKKF